MSEETKEVKVLIDCPTFGLDPDPKRWLHSLLVAMNELHRSGAKTSFLFPYRNGIHKADNKMVQVALTNGFTHILRMDDDVWGVEPGDITKLLAADKEFISAVMFVAGFPYSRCAQRKKPGVTLTLPEIERTRGDFLEEVAEPGVQPVDLTAMPFTLFKVSLFEKMTFPFFDPKAVGSPDGVFCQKCLDMGVQPYIHNDIQLNHREVTPWNRVFLYNAEIRRMLYKKQVDPTIPEYAKLVELYGEDGQKDPMIVKGCEEVENVEQ